MKKRLLSMVLLAAVCAVLNSGCGSLPKHGAPPKPPGAPGR